MQLREVAYWCTIIANITQTPVASITKSYDLSYYVSNAGQQLTQPHVIFSHNVMMLPSPHDASRVTTRGNAHS